MKIATPEEHVALKYVATVTDQGGAVTRDQLAQYVHRRLVGGLAMGMQAWTMLQGSPEPVASRLIRIGWLQESAAKDVSVTELGKHVLAGLEREETEISEIAEIVLDPKDPLSYPRVIAELARHSSAMLVDPYFRLSQLLDIIQRTTLDRVLISEGISKSDRSGLQQAMQNLNITRPFEIRVAKRSELHDRFLIPPKGPVQMLGTSLNQVGSKLTVLVRIEDPSARKLRKEYENIWSSAPPL